MRLTGFFAGRCCYSEHDASASRVRLQLRDAEWLCLYVQSGMAKRETHSASLKEAELTCRRLELEAKESAERASRAEAERDAVCHEAAMAKL